MHFLLHLIDIVRHLDQYLNQWSGQLGPWLYAVLFLIVFVETGLVVMPFLPGDSLLFAIGALAASQDSTINLPLVMVLLCAAANLGDVTNYSIGKRAGPKVFSGEKSWLLNRKHLLEAQRFYERHGRKTIILARFVPIIRTFAPFVAGIGRMAFSRFITFSVGGAILWVVSLSLAGYFFGQISVIKKNFELVVLAIVFISVLPAIAHVLKARFTSSRSSGESLPQSPVEPAPGPGLGP